MRRNCAARFRAASPGLKSLLVDAEAGNSCVKRLPRYLLAFWLRRSRLRLGLAFLTCRFHHLSLTPDQVAPRSAGTPDTGDDSCFNQVSSTEKVSPSVRITARSTTFCNSRMLPGQPYAWNSFERFARLLPGSFYRPSWHSVDQVFDQ